MPPILSLHQVTKQYPGVLALDNVDFSLDKGEVRALLGKNGAGKSTLVKILSGANQPDSGEIRIDDKPVSIPDTRAAFDMGICTVYQEMSLVPGLTVAENILLGRWPQLRLGAFSMIDHAKIRKIARGALDQLEVTLNLDEQVSRLSIAQQQLVEIAKAISFSPRVMVLDEPTSALPAGEVAVLHKVVRRLAEQGHGIIYVTHRLQEIPRVADTVTVLRDGKVVGTIQVAEATPKRIANMMIGADWQPTEWGAKSNPGAVKLAVRHLNRKGWLNDVTFELYGGEVLGIAGLLGSGRTELVRAIFGADAIDSGEIQVNGTIVSHPSPNRMKANGIGLTPEDRKRQGLILPFAVLDNLTLASLNRLNIHGILQRQRAQGLAMGMVESLSIKTASLSVPTGTLSGGNQQKVVIGNWLNTQPDVLLMDEPTRGIDIQAKEQIFHLVRDLAQQGIGILFISSEIEEVLEVADRILVMNRGYLTHQFRRGEIDLETLMTLVMEEIGHGQDTASTSPASVAAPHA
ncbi:MAG: sugar ABC transporter ATP-binding protein [Anaerolineae bacterium]|nr:sugar ABC transporter ATP-binding protein [Anaerolineae bacterium]